MMSKTRTKDRECCVLCDKRVSSTTHREMRELDRSTKAYLRRSIPAADFDDSIPLCAACWGAHACN